VKTVFRRWNIEGLMFSRDNIYRILQSVALLLASCMFLELFQVPANPYIAFGLTSSFVGFLATERAAKRIAAVVMLAAAYAILFAKFGGVVDHYSGWLIAYPTGLLGLAGIVASMLRWFWSSEDPVLLKRNVAMQASIPALCAISSLFVGNAIKWTPRTYDYTVYAFDTSLGAPSFVLGRFMGAHPGIFQFCAGIYNALPLWVGLGWMLLTLFPSRRDWRPQACFIALGITGFALYQLCPVAGPAYRFAGQFPWTQLSPAALPTGAQFLIPCARNAMPSLHIAWMLLLVYCSLEWIWPARVFSMGIAAVTLAAMLGSGEHYLIDAIVSTPLLLCLIAAGMRKYALSAAAGIFTIAWLLAFRSGIALDIPDAARIAAASLTLLAAIAGILKLRTVRPEPQGVSGLVSLLTRKPII
jgi:hypothetical protein